MIEQADKAHRDHADALVREQAFGISQMEGISIEDAMKRIRTGHSEETSPVHPTHAASVARRAEDRQTTR